MKRSVLGDRCRLAGGLLIGVGVSTASPLAIAVSVAMPGIFLRQGTRCGAYQTAVAFYAVALWPLIPGARNFFGPKATALAAVSMWAVAALLLALPWALVWTKEVRRALWRAPLGIALTVVPPLGIIGWASPLTASGILFPRFGWVGVILCALVGGALAIWPRRTLATACAIVLAANLTYRQPAPPLGWEGVDTSFGAISHGLDSSLAEYRSAQWIQQRALSSSAKVMIFPETVVPAWTAATDAFWRPTVEALRSSEKTILVGARIPTPAPGTTLIPATDFSTALAALSSDSFLSSIPPHSHAAAIAFP